MIEYTIIVNHGKDQSLGKQQLTPDMPEFKELVLRRNIRQNQYRVEDRVKIRRGHKRGIITGIEYDIDKVNWDNNRPHFIRVLFDDGIEMLCTSQQLKRSKI